MREENVRSEFGSTYLDYVGDLIRKIQLDSNSVSAVCWKRRK